MFVTGCASASGLGAMAGGAGGAFVGLLSGATEDRLRRRFGWPWMADKKC